MDEWKTVTRRGAALLLLTSLGSLAAPSDGSGQISPRCGNAEYRELDFWGSEDGGVTWSVIFDGRYHPVETAGG